jgi:transcriptional regulator GlxA family with amidase domain
VHGHDVVMRIGGRALLERGRRAEQHPVARPADAGAQNPRVIAAIKRMM